MRPSRTGGYTAEFTGADETTLSNRVLTENHNEGIAGAGDLVTGIDPLTLSSPASARRTP